VDRAGGAFDGQGCTGWIVPVAASMGRDGVWVLDVKWEGETLGVGLNSSQVGAGQAGMAGEV
jgi:hypothetical protein